MKHNYRVLLSASFFLVLSILACNLPGISKTETPKTVPNLQPETLETLPAAVVTPPAEQNISATEAAPEPVLRLFYTDGAFNLWTWTESTGSFQLTTTGDVDFPVPAPDGSKVVYTRTSDYLNYSFWAVNNDGSNSRQLISPEDFKLMNTDLNAQGLAPDFITWLPDAENLLFTTSPKYEGPGYTIQEDLWILNVTSGENRQLLSPGMGGSIHLSPDGTKLALIKPQSISIANTDGTDLKQIFTYPRVITYSEYLYRAEPVWASDSSNLLVAIPPEDPMIPGQQTEIWDLAADGSTTQKVASINTNFIGSTAISPDLQKILFINDGSNPNDNIREVHVVNRDGSNDTLIAVGRVSGVLGWTPDSTQFFFNEGDKFITQLGQVGGSYRPLTDTGNAVMTEFIDSNNFFYANKTDSGFEIRKSAIGNPSQVVIPPNGTPDVFVYFDVTQKN